MINLFVGVGGATVTVAGGCGCIYGAVVAAGAAVEPGVIVTLEAVFAMGVGVTQAVKSALHLSVSQDLMVKMPLPSHLKIESNLYSLEYQHFVVFG